MLGVGGEHYRETQDTPAHVKQRMQCERACSWQKESQTLHSAHFQREALGIHSNVEEIRCFFPLPLSLSLSDKHNRTYPRLGALPNLHGARAKFLRTPCVSHTLSLFSTGVLWRRQSRFPHSSLTALLNHSREWKTQAPPTSESFPLAFPSHRDHCHLLELVSAARTEGYRLQADVTWLTIHNCLQLYTCQDIRCKYH